MQRGLPLLLYWDQWRYNISLTQFRFVRSWIKISRYRQFYSWNVWLNLCSISFFFILKNRSIYSRFIVCVSAASHKIFPALISLFTHPLQTQTSGSFNSTILSFWLAVLNTLLTRIPSFVFYYSRFSPFFFRFSQRSTFENIFIISHVLFLLCIDPYLQLLGCFSWLNGLSV